jgi:hypothetical protein
MAGTYVSLLLILVASGLVGQAAFSLCGRRSWSWLSPAVGLALLVALAWGTVRLPGEGTAALAALGIVTAASVAVLYRSEVRGLEDVLRVGVPVALAAALAASLPFIVEGRFGILGTGLNPDMSQHLFAADRLAGGGTERLISSGYPLGPHSLVVALGALGISSVHAFGGLTLATAVIASLSSLGLLGELALWRRMCGALLVGLAYMTASYLVQGAFKETMEALYVLAFAIGLHELSTGRLSGRLDPVPLAALAIGAVYTYSFPGLLWLAGAAGIWVLAEVVVRWRGEGREAAVGRVREAAAPACIALGALVLAVAPEIGRMADFASFETFDPKGEGLGNLFNRISPFEALGIWPSGDFRLDAGAGAVPAIGFWLGCALALTALIFGLWWWLRRRELAVPAALAAAFLLVAYAAISGTPYQEAKAIAIAAAPAMLIPARALLVTAIPARQVERILRRRELAVLLPRTARIARLRLAVVALAVTFLGGSALCSLLALANGPVGPTTYSPALTELRPLGGSTLVLAPQSLLDQHGRDYAVWELRGGRVCVEPESLAELPEGISQVITLAGVRPPGSVREAKTRGAYTVWWVTGARDVAGPCPLISPGARAKVTEGG